MKVVSGNLILNDIMKYDAFKYLINNSVSYPNKFSKLRIN